MDTRDSSLKILREYLRKTHIGFINDFNTFRMGDSLLERGTALAAECVAFQTDTLLWVLN